MDAIDRALAELGAIRAPDQLAMMDEAVLARLSVLAAGSAGGSFRAMGVAGVAALAIGMMSAIAPSGPADASTHVSPLVAPSALAPSSLLVAPE